MVQILGLNSQVYVAPYGTNASVDATSASFTVVKDIVESYSAQANITTTSYRTSCAQSSLITTKDGARYFTGQFSTSSRDVSFGGIKLVAGQPLALRMAVDRNDRTGFATDPFAGTGVFAAPFAFITDVEQVWNFSNRTFRQNVTFETTGDASVTGVTTPGLHYPDVLPCDTDNMWPGCTVSSDTTLPRNTTVATVNVTGDSANPIPLCVSSIRIRYSRPLYRKANACTGAWSIGRPMPMTTSLEVRVDDDCPNLPWTNPNSSQCLDFKFYLDECDMTYYVQLEGWKTFTRFNQWSGDIDGQDYVGYTLSSTASGSGCGCNTSGTTEPTAKLYYQTSSIDLLTP